MNSSELTYVVLLALVALLCGLLPPLRRMGDRSLHVALAAATGIFLGAVFLDLLPALTHDHDHDHDHGAEIHAVPAHAHSEDEAHSHEAAPSHAGHAHVDGATMIRWLAVLAGLLTVYLVESLALRSLDSDDHHRHRAVAWGALLGLSIHALVRGVELAVPDNTSVSSFSLVPLAHRGAEAFALAAILALAHVRRARATLALVVFALLTPLGWTTGTLLGLSHAPHALGIVQGFAAGIFLFVALCELLPEVFHHREDGLAKIALLGGGIIAAYWSG